MKNPQKKNLLKEQIAGNKEIAPQDRRMGDRRKTDAEGYAYISMVGWMDRRECGRRTTDIRQYEC